MYKIANMERKRMPYYRKARSLMRAALRSYTNDLVERLRKCSTAQQMRVEADKVVKSDKIALAMRGIYTDTGQYFAKETIKVLKKKKALDPSMRGNLTDDYWLNYMEQVFRSKLANRIKWITGTTEEIFKETVRNITEQGLQEGLSVYQMTEQIRKELNITEVYRAERISRTEVAAASNEASVAGAESVGMELNKVWISYIDDRTREDHIELDGKVVGFDEDFMPGLPYPCAVGGSPDQVINCRCTIGYEEKDNSINIGRF